MMHQSQGRGLLVYVVIRLENLLEAIQGVHFYPTVIKKMECLNTMAPTDVS
jgi:hypothetical protein